MQLYHKGWAVKMLPCSQVQLFYWRDSHKWSLNKFMVKLNRKRNLSTAFKTNLQLILPLLQQRYEKKNNDNFTFFTLSHMNKLLYALTHRTRITFSNPRAEIGTRESQNGLENKCGQNVFHWHSFSIFPLFWLRLTPSTACAWVSESIKVVRAV